MFLNKYCILGFVLVAIAGLWFPVGIVVDVFIIIGIVYFKNKAGAKKDKEKGLQQGSNDDIFKLMALSMISGNSIQKQGTSLEKSSAKSFREEKMAHADDYSMEYKKKYLY